MKIKKTDKKGKKLQRTYSSSKPVTSIVIQIETKNIYDVIERIRKKENVNVSAGDIIIHAICQCIKKHLQFNSSYDKQLKIFKIYKSIHLEYLINLGRGPETVVIRDAHKKSIAELSKEVKKFALKYIHGTISEKDRGFGTITITNLSAFNAYLVTTPVYEHQTAMFAIASEFDMSQEKKRNQLKKFNLTLSYDARAADCQTALQLLNSIKDMLEK